MDGSYESVNPLLQIDTDFRTYLNAYTRSFQNHVVGKHLDYAFESDFAVRQKLAGLPGWGRLARAVNGTDIAAEAKYLLLNCEQAGVLKYPEIYDIVKKCAERLQTTVPTVFIRKDIEKPMIYSAVGNVIEPCIILTESISEKFNDDELTFLIGSEMGRLQNNHIVYNWAYTYVNRAKEIYKPVERSYKSTVSNRISILMNEWIRYADITADRAGIICLDEPGRFCEIVCSIYTKGYIDFYGRIFKNPDASKLKELSDSYTGYGVRTLKKEVKHTPMESRILASSEFLRSLSLFFWRTDLDKRGVRTITDQICDVRSSMILGTGDQ